MKTESAHRAEAQPLPQYAALATVFNGLYLGAVGAAAARHELPERMKVGDLVLLGAATHKLSRLIARDKVTAFLRAPFTEFEEEAGHGEVDERPRGRGLRRAVGELVSCPYCLGMWVAGGLTVAWI